MSALNSLARITAHSVRRTHPCTPFCTQITAVARDRLSRISAGRNVHSSQAFNTMKLSIALLASGAAALAPNLNRATQLASAVPKAPIAAAAAVVAAAPAPALAAGLSSGDLILPVGGLTLLLTGVIAGILGYTTIGDGPANPKNRG